MDKPDFVDPAVDDYSTLNGDTTLFVTERDRTKDNT